MDDDLDDRAGAGAGTADSFPRQYARTQRFTLGDPRDITVSPDGERIVFLRSQGGSDPVTCLWTVDAASGKERLVADPRELAARDEPAARGDASDAELPPEERARRERLRESASGITGYATDEHATVAAFALNGRLYAAGLVSARARHVDVPGPVFDPRPDPVAQRVAYVSGRQLRIAELSGTSRVLAGDDPTEADTVSWGSADFIAAEEMRRLRGYWWSPDGTAIAACRVDVEGVLTWTIADPADPGSPANVIRYPAAGTQNPDVRLFVCPLDGSPRREVTWDREALPYLANVQWNLHGLHLTVQSRDQRTLSILAADPLTGTTDEVFTDTDDHWVELVPGTPRFDAQGRLITCADRDGARRLLVDGVAVTPTDQQVRGVVAVLDNDRHADGADGVGHVAEATSGGRQPEPGEAAPGDVIFLANPIDDATVQAVWRLRADGSLQALTDEPGIHTAAAGGGTIVVRAATLDETGATTTSLDGVSITSHAATPLVEPAPHLLTIGERDLAAAVLLPSDRERHAGRSLPVLLDPYGGPHAQRVVAARSAYLIPQWFADQGFVVIVIDGRGSPGRGSAWEREVHADLATAPLDDQVAGLYAIAELMGSGSGFESDGITCDLSSVAIRGWSFGGYLAALAVLRRPDVFATAIAGAPVTEWRLYDTHYTERYLGHPDDTADAYDASSLLPLAPKLERPLLLIHGLADDNVVAAHTLQLSSALLSAGKPHEVLPLVGVTHMTPQEVVAENLLLHQLDFLRRTLDVPG